MKMNAFAFGTTNWAEVERTEHRGETGVAFWRTRFFGEKPNQIRVRMVEYTLGYLADHWCQKAMFFSVWKASWKRLSKMDGNSLSQPA